MKAYTQRPAPSATELCHDENAFIAPTPSALRYFYAEDMTKVARDRFYIGARDRLNVKH